MEKHEIIEKLEQIAYIGVISPAVFFYLNMEQSFIVLDENILVHIALIIVFCSSVAVLVYNYSTTLPARSESQILKGLYITLGLFSALLFVLNTVLIKLDYLERGYFTIPGIILFSIVYAWEKGSQIKTKDETGLFIE